MTKELEGSPIGGLIWLTGGSHMSAIRWRGAQGLPRLRTGACAAGGPRRGQTSSATTQGRRGSGRRRIGCRLCTPAASSQQTATLSRLEPRRAPHVCCLASVVEALALVGGGRGADRQHLVGGALLRSVVAQVAQDSVRLEAPVRHDVGLCN